MLDRDWYVLFAHPYLEVTRMFGPYDSHEQAREDADEWFRAAAFAYQLLREGEEPIQVRVIQVSLRPTASQMGHDYIYSTYLQRQIGEGRERFARTQAQQAKDIESRTQEHERRAHDRREAREDARRRQEAEEAATREANVVRLLQMGVREREISLLDIVEDLQRKLEACEKRLTIERQLRGSIRRPPPERTPRTQRPEPPAEGIPSAEAP